jgi:hypothetical protein
MPSYAMSDCAAREHALSCSYTAARRLAEPQIIATVWDVSAVSTQGGERFAEFPALLVASCALSGEGTLLPE